MTGQESKSRIRFCATENESCCAEKSSFTTDSNIHSSISTSTSTTLRTRISQHSEQNLLDRLKDPDPINSYRDPPEKNSSCDQALPQHLLDSDPAINSLHASILLDESENRRNRAKSVSITGSSHSECSGKVSALSSDKARSTIKNSNIRQAPSVSDEKHAQCKKGNKRQESSVDSEGYNNTDDSSSSKNMSEGGYAGSASSNEESNETDKQTKKTSEPPARAKRFAPSSSCSSDIADFSSGTSDSGSGCSTFISCSDVSEDSRHEPMAKPNPSQREQLDTNKISSDASPRVNNNEPDKNRSDASVDSSSSLRAVAPIRKQSSKKSNSPSSLTTSGGKEEKRIDISKSGNYFVSFAKRKRSRSKRRHHNSSHKSAKKIKPSKPNRVSTNSSSALSTGQNNSSESRESNSNNDHDIKSKQDQSQTSQSTTSMETSYALHQANLKRNYLDAFSRHEKDSKKQHLSRKMRPEGNKREKEVTELTKFRKLPTKSNNTEQNPTPIYDIGCDIMAQILSFLSYLEIHTFLTMPLSKKWCETYMFPQDLWRILCVSPPFFVRLSVKNRTMGGSDSSSTSECESTSDQSEEDSYLSFPAYEDLKVKHIFGVYRLLYSSFVRCVRYLDQIKEDAMKGRTPRGMKSSFVPASSRGKFSEFDANAQIHKYLAALKGARETSESSDDPSWISPSTNPMETSSSDTAFFGRKSIVEVDTKKSENNQVSFMEKKKSSSEKSSDSASKKSKPKFGHSKLTERLLGATKQGNAGPVDLPWSCAIYSVVNWMVAFIDVLGIQIMCLKVLPCLLEDEHQRTTAQRAGLTDIVLKGMIIFPNSVELHTAAFHALVLLARPLGGREGMLFHQTMVGDTSNILDVGSSSKSNCCKNGIAVMLDSMRRFRSNERLQAMSCWAMVNIALIATQKTMLVKLGGISVAANAMMQHPNSAEVQFRALFALINLAIPSSTQTHRDTSSATLSSLGEIMSDSSEREILDESIGQITNLVVVAMKNFCSSEAIMNRACLVLHNLSLNDQYHTTLLWTPNCYQMLEWAMGNYRYDHVLQQSAGGTLQRLQRTLRSDSDLHSRFAAFIRTQQQSSLDIARREAQLLETRRQGRNPGQRNTS